MIRIDLITAPEATYIDGQWWDSAECLNARIDLRERVEAWQRSSAAVNYPPVQIYRDVKEFEKPMVAYMLFDTEEEAALFKLTHSSI